MHMPKAPNSPVPLVGRPVQNAQTAPRVHPYAAVARQPAHVFVPVLSLNPTRMGFHCVPSQVALAGFMPLAVFLAAAAFTAAATLMNLARVQRLSGPPAEAAPGGKAEEFGSWQKWQLGSGLIGLAVVPQVWGPRGMGVRAGAHRAPAQTRDCGRPKLSSTHGFDGSGSGASAAAVKVCLWRPLGYRVLVRRDRAKATKLVLSSLP